MKFSVKGLLSGLMLTVFSLTLCGAGCGPQYAYEDELLDSHNKIITLQDQSIAVNQQMVIDNGDFLDKYEAERFDLENMDYERLESILAKVDTGCVDVQQYLNELNSEAARFTGYMDGLDEENKQCASDFIENIKLSSDYYGMAMDDMGSYIAAVQTALGEFSNGYYDEGNVKIDEAISSLDTYSENLSLQNDYADKAYEADIKFIVSMGWAEATEE